MKTFRSILILSVLCLLPLNTALAGADIETSRDIYEIDELVWNECTGEYVHITGSVHAFNHVVTTDGGIHKWNFQERYQGVKGVGEDSGIIYQAIKGDNGYGSMVEISDHPYHYAVGQIITIRMIAQGSAPDFVLKSHFHLTVTPNAWTALIDHYDVVCK